MKQNIFDQMLSRYEIRTDEDFYNASREIMQQVALAGLYRGGFFEKAAFYGGTCLRIFHKLERFSEDMDFSLLKPDSNFNLENYFGFIINEFKSLGKEVVINKKNKKTNTNIESAFLKEDTSIYDLQFSTDAQIKIKLEVDINPPPGFKTENKLLLLPFSFMTNCYQLPDLYAGKMHALLFRNWKNRVKGRDWYDFEWYVRNDIPLNFNHFCERTKQFNSLSGNSITKNEFTELLLEKIKHTNMASIRNDVRPFIKEPRDIEIWSVEYFLELVKMMRIEGALVQ